MDEKKITNGCLFSALMYVLIFIVCILLWVVKTINNGRTLLRRLHVRRGNPATLEPGVGWPLHLCTLPAFKPGAFEIRTGVRTFQIVTIGTIFWEPVS